MMHTSNARRSFRRPTSPRTAFRPSLFFPMITLGCFFGATIPGAADNFFKQSIPITLEIGQASGGVGSTVEIPVDLQANGQDPATIVFFIDFDDAALEYVGVEAGPAALAADKVVQDGSNEPDRIGFVIWQVNNNTMADGTLLTATFRINDGSPGEWSALTGSRGSASTADDTPQGIPVEFIDGLVLFEEPCVPPLAPTFVNASDGEFLGVTVTWMAVDGATAYQVWRADTNNLDAAEAISGWITATEFLDTTAEPAALPPGFPGCYGLPDIQTYWYWVRARDAEQCETDFSAPDTGYRGFGPKAGLAAAVSGDNSPHPPSEEMVPAETPSDVGLKLSSAQPIDPTSIWCAAACRGATSDAFTWMPVRDGDLREIWVLPRADGPWPRGAVVSLEAGAVTILGDPVGPVTREFVIGLAGTVRPPTYPSAPPSTGKGTVNMGDAFALSVVPFALLLMTALFSKSRRQPHLHLPGALVGPGNR